jgi:hypothetical protein
MEKIANKTLKEKINLKIVLGVQYSFNYSFLYVLLLMLFIVNALFQVRRGSISVMIGAEEPTISSVLDLLGLSNYHDLFEREQIDIDALVRMHLITFQVSSILFYISLS